jgi:hypothetical protein
MFRKSWLAVLVLCVSASFAFGQSVTLPVWVAGTDWSGSEDRSGYEALRFVFSATSVTMMDRDGSISGTWEQKGDQITMNFDDGRVVYAGIIQGQVCDYTWSFPKNVDDFYVFHVSVNCRGARMSGTAQNVDGSRWNWTTSMVPLALEVSGVYDRVPFDFPIYLDSTGSGSGETILGRESPSPTELSTWRIRLMQR